MPASRVSQRGGRRVTPVAGWIATAGAAAAAAAEALECDPLQVLLRQVTPPVLSATVAQVMRLRVEVPGATKEVLMGVARQRVASDGRDVLPGEVEPTAHLVAAVGVHQLDACGDRGVLLQGVGANNFQSLANVGLEYPSICSLYSCEIPFSGARERDGAAMCQAAAPSMITAAETNTAMAGTDRTREELF